MTTFLIAAFFLPLFPFGAAFNAALARAGNPWLRSALLLLWPQVGVWLLHDAAAPVPQAFVAWALASAGLYAMRLLTVRDLGVWAGFLATSALATGWVLVADGVSVTELHIFALWFSLPSVLLTLLTRPLVRRFSAAYAGLNGGLIHRLPRLSGVLVLIVLAAVATPPFPGFFLLLDLLNALDWVGAVVLLAIWLVWGWAAARLLQGFVSGSDLGAPVADIGRPHVWAFAGALGVYLATGLFLTGGGL